MEPEVILARCPPCAATEEHEILKATANNLTVKCSECGNVHSISPARMRPVDVNAVISNGEESYRTQIPTPTDEEVAVGLEFDLDDHRMVVTGIEIEGQQRPAKALAKNIRTLFAKVFDTVPLKLSINEGDKTRSYRIDVDPDFEVPIGLVLEVDDRKLVIKTLKSDMNRTIHRGFLYARNVRRAFCDPAHPRAKVGQISMARRRGAPLSAKGKPPAKRLKGPRGQRTPKRS